MYSGLQSSRPWLAAAALLGACAEQDVTLATGVADPVRVPLPVAPAPVPPPSLAAPEVVRPPAIDAGTPVAPPVPPALGAKPPEASAPPPVLALRCDALPAAPLAYETLTGFTASEDFAFDAQGNYVGIDEDENLVRISKSGAKQLWAPAVGSTAGMAVLPDGSLVVCDVEQGALRRIHTNGSSTVLLGGLSYPNGLTIGPDGFVYVAENDAGRVRRIHPDTGEYSVVAMGLYGANGVAFGTDPAILYVGSFEGHGVYRVELAAPGELGSARVFAETPGASLPEPASLCRELQVGERCESDYHIAASCQVLANVLDCAAIDPCPELAEGEFCDFPSVGECQGGRCVFIPDACKTGQEGDPCRMPGVAVEGQCRWYLPDPEQPEERELICVMPNPCEGLQVGDSCQGTYFEAEGECVDYGLGELGCSPRDPCDGKAEGAACEDLFGDYTGTCRDVGDLSYCSPPTGCEDKQRADPCQDPLSGFTGNCLELGGELFCSGPTGCEDKQPAEPCVEPNSDFEGICSDGGGSLVCGAPTGCEDKQLGEPCVDPFHETEGFCVEYGGPVYCAPPTGCEGKEQGGACIDPESQVEGTCQDGFGVLLCTPPDRCEGKAAGDACGEPPDGSRCVDHDGSLYCELGCEGRADGERCHARFTGAGYCSVGECLPLGSPGAGIDGLGVDACGNVYATEYASGIIWRIDPQGQLEQLVRLPSMWIPNLEWGHDLGGFSSDTLYVADRDHGRLFALPVGVPSAAALRGEVAK